jgi:hypothetical protein
VVDGFESTQLKGLVVSPAREKRKKMPEKIEKGGNEGSHIGPRGGSKDIIDGFRFSAWGNKFHLR